MQINKTIIFELNMTTGNEFTLKELLPAFNKNERIDELNKLICKKLQDKISEEFNNEQPVNNLNISFNILAGGRINSLDVIYKFDKELTDLMQQKFEEVTLELAKEFVKTFKVDFEFKPKKSLKEIITKKSNDNVFKGKLETVKFKVK